MDVLSFDRKYSNEETWRKSLLTWINRIPHRDGCRNNAEDDTELRGKEAYFMLDIRQSSVSVGSLNKDLKNKLGISNMKLRDIPRLEMHCIDANGRSAMVTVVGEFPYFYARPKQNGEIDLAEMKVKINNLLGKHIGDNEAVIKLEIQQKETLMGYKGSNMTEPTIKITLSSSFLVPKLREGIKRGELSGFDGQIFEGNIPFELRFMIDRNLQGCSWFAIPDSCVTRTNVNQIISDYCDQRNASLGALGLEERSWLIDRAIDVHIDQLEVLDMEKQRWSSIPRELRIMSFDIECTTLGRKGFPKAESDPVIAISIVLKEFGGTTLDKVVLCLRETAGLAEGTIVWFSHEADLLLAFCEYVRLSDPDFLTGYNCFNFDLNYLIDRSQTLNIKEKFGFMSRIPGHKATVENARLASKGLGIKEYKNIDLPGRICLDVLEAIRKEYKLKSYSLNAVSAHFLDQQKEDVHYSIIGDLFEGGPDTRRRIASYCLKDSVLPLNLLDKLLIVVNMVEMARVTGVPMTYLITRGQQIKVTSQILRHCRSTDFIMPVSDASRDGSNDPYEGATVLEPQRDFYLQPITTLDFASLYPSIMIAHNLCYTTWIQPHNRNKVRQEVANDNITHAPKGDEFVKSNVRCGILPTIVNNLITARKKARKMIAEAKDPLTKMVLNGRQLALKISANSVYGYTGAASAGQLPCLAVSTSITAFGRQMIDTTKEIVEKHYTIANGYDSNANVVYGDTDSVMIDFGVTTVKKGMELGSEAADLVSAQFIEPIKLEFEKVFCPYLLMNKKRYAGLLWSSSSEKWDKMDCKGIETVRRDFCDLVQISVDTVLKEILINKDVDGAKTYVRNTISKLMTNDVDMSLLVMTKSIGKDDYTSKLAHVELAKRMKERDPGNAPQVGDRVHYVIIAKGKNVPQYEKAEDPLHVLENNLSLDTTYYLDCLKKPICRVLEPCMINENVRPESIFEGGDHTLSRVKSFNKGGAMSKFMNSSKKIERCLGCRKSLKTNETGLLCDNCQSKRGRVITSDIYKNLGTLQKEFCELWTQCQNCQGSLLQDVICTSRDCPIFYRRTKVRKDLAKAEERVWGVYESW